MSTRDGFEGLLSDWLDDKAGRGAPDYVDEILVLTTGTRQRPAWSSLGRWLPMQTTLRFAPMPRLGWVLLIALAIVAAVGIAVLAAGSRSPQVPPPFGPARNGLIVYSKDGDVFAGNATTGDTRPLLADQAVDSLPKYSRDGSMVAFQRFVDAPSNSNNDNTYRLMVMKADGSDVRAVTAEPIIDPVSWDRAPDGRSLYVVGPSLTETGTRTLSAYPIDGSGAPRMLVDAGADGITVLGLAARPPDGREILVRGSVAGQQVGLWVMAPDRTGLRVLIPPISSQAVPRTLRGLQYSPDGSRIAFSSLDQQHDIERLYVMRSDGTDRRELGADPDIWATVMPAWSNDGTRLAVQRGHRGTDASQEVVTYAVIDVATGTVTETGRAPGWGGVTWAPDDSSLLVRHGDGAATDLLLDPAGGLTKAIPWISDDLPDWQRLAP